jgi:hypothetical protein
VNIVIIASIAGDIDFLIAAKDISIYTAININHTMIAFLADFSIKDQTLGHIIDCEVMSDVLVINHFVTSKLCMFLDRSATFSSDSILAFTFILVSHQPTFSIITLGDV